MPNNLQTMMESIQKKYSGQVAVSVSEQTGEYFLTVDRGQFMTVMQDLRDNPEYAFVYLANVTAIDYPGNFVAVYNLFSYAHRAKLTVQVKLPKDDPQIPSVFGLWKAADFQEREVYDLMGIVLTGHPNLKRILLADDFGAHPLRKDFKLEVAKRQ